MVQSIFENDYLNGEVIRLDGALRFPPSKARRETVRVTPHYGRAGCHNRA